MKSSYAYSTKEQRSASSELDKLGSQCAWFKSHFGKALFFPFQ